MRYLRQETRLWSPSKSLEHQDQPDLVTKHTEGAGDHQRPPGETSGLHSLPQVRKREARHVADSCANGRRDSSLRRRVFCLRGSSEQLVLAAFRATVQALLIRGQATTRHAQKGRRPDWPAREWVFQLVHSTPRIPCEQTEDGLEQSPHRPRHLDHPYPDRHAASPALS